ncbi:MAG: biopolymer transporter ExbD [Candidatus Sumerlaeia bacterium]
MRAARPSIPTRPRRRRKLTPGINLTPMLDIVFNLLFFFVMTTEIRQGATQLQVRLPEASSASKVAPVPVPTLTLDAQGRIFYESQPVGDAELELVLRGVAQKGGHEVRLRGDETVDLGRAVKVMDLCRKTGLNMSLMTQAPGDRMK